MIKCDGHMVEVGCKNQSICSLLLELSATISAVEKYVLDIAKEHISDEELAKIASRKLVKGACNVAFDSDFSKSVVFMPKDESKDTGKQFQSILDAVMEAIRKEHEND